VDYLGHKAALLRPIVVALETAARRRLKVLDAFSGTAVVAAELRARGHRVHANDQLALCGAWARSALLSPRRPAFVGLVHPGWRSARPYQEVLRQLNHLEPVEGFFTQHFSPASAGSDRVERRYVTVENATRIDAVRRRIADWHDHLTPGDEALLLSTLVAAVMEVSNTAGTYGCYLKHWKAKAHQPLTLRPLALPADDNTDHVVTDLDAADAAAESDADVIYADPPYTKRQYAAYYHVLETLVRGDEPRLVGSTGLRDWRSQASDWCHRRKAPAALEALISKSSAPRIVMSYNEDGQIDHEVIVETMRAHGSVTVAEVVMRRYRSSRRAHKGQDVVERIYALDRR
jgi:adenine-specific DNA-methyltransferase